jgi:hypothetical protein
MSATYFWHQDQLVVLNRALVVADFNQAAMLKYRYCPCVDTFEEEPEKRYGFWASYDRDRDWKATWQHRSLASFPEEFKTHLLLLGVS